MAGLLKWIMASTIAARLAVLLAFPVAGTLVLGALVAKDERAATLAARELRREAELVELLSSLTIALDVEADAIEGYHEAAILGVDVNNLEGLFGSAGPAEGVTQRSVNTLLTQVASQDNQRWSDSDAVAQLLVGAGSLEQYTGVPSDDNDGFALLRGQVSEAAELALSAQIQQLDRRFGQVELGLDLAAVTRSMEPARRVLAAAQDERQALAEYLLPLSGDRPKEELYRDLIVANARYELDLTALEESLPLRHALLLDEMQHQETWMTYNQLRDQALDGQALPAADTTNPMALVPTGLVTFVNGFERIGLLSDLERQLSTDFAASAEQMEVEANQRLIRVVAAGVLLAIITVAISFFTIRSIARPVQSLLERARHITDGHLDRVRPVGGPSDIDMVHAALDEMTVNLQTLSDQAEALSAGRLDDDVLNRRVLGPLGQSVHGSVVRLRSMTTRLEHEATHDSLTGLPNRAALFALLDRALTGPEDRRQPLAAVMLDLDGFKQANDNMGHAAGDEVLCVVAKRLLNQARGHFVARLGGDEFMMIVTGTTAAEEALVIARNAVSSIREPMALSGGRLDVSASAGVVDTGFGDWLPPSEVLRRVDVAMYEAKADSPGEVVRFDQRLHDSLLATTQLSDELRQALSRDEFHLDLQPIVATIGGAVSGYEALIRWDSPLRGSVSPDLFIGVAEQSELIGQIDTWVIGQSAEILACWRDDPHMADLTLSINLSARHLSRPDLAVQIADVIDLHQLRADRYMIEITESQLIPNLARAEDNLRLLKEIGVRLAIDGFGTGYASVAHLRRVAFDRVKIDQSLLAHLADETGRSLATLLVSLGRDLNFEVVAEGIETVEQLRWATHAGCTHGQGLFLGPPQPADNVRSADDVALSALRVD